MQMPNPGNRLAQARSRFNRKWMWAVVALAVVAIIVLWQVLASGRGEPVRTAEVNRGDIDIFVSAPAEVTLPSRADLNFKTGGKIQAIYVKKGDTVAAGQTLAELDMGAIIPQINQAEAGLKLAQANLSKLLSGRSRRETAVAEAQVGQARGAVESARRSLKTAGKLAGQSRQKAALNVQNAQESVNIAQQQLNKARSGAASQQRLVSQSQADQAYQALQDAQENYNRVVALNEELYEEADLACTQARAARDELEETSATASQLRQAQEAVDRAVAARSRISASNDQSRQAAQAQLNSARKAYDTALAQRDAANASARSEDIAIAESQLRQAEVALEIARIGQDDASIDAQIDQAQAQLDSAIASSRVAIAQLELQRQGPGAADVRAAQAQIEQARAQLDAAGATAEDAVLKAPFAGKVAAINGKIGEIAGLGAATAVGNPATGATSASTALITLINFDRIEVSADVDETEISKLRLGQDVRLSLDAYENRVFNGKVTNTSLLSSRNATGGTIFEVIVVVNPSRAEFREGMNGDIEIITSSKKGVLTVPFDAVKFENGRRVAYVIEDNVAHRREIETGLASDTAYEVKSGLKEGEKVAVGRTTLTEGQRVSIEN